MLPIIAQSLPGPDKDFAWQAILLAVAILSAASTAASLWSVIWGRNKPQKTQVENDPLVVTEAREYAPRKQVEALEHKVDNNHTDVLNRLASLEETRRSSVSKVYDAMRHNRRSPQRTARGHDAAPFRNPRRHARHPRPPD